MIVLPLAVSPEARTMAQPGETVVTTETSIDVVEDEGNLIVLEMGVSIGEIARALNAIGATPRDLIAIFQAIKASGALHAELLII